jgi:NAD(P)-dependent dehydrogenase (short-subunit alcohol dehydrogenase family)
MGRLDGRVAIVTGGARGIGKVYSEALAREGATVVIADIVDGGAVPDAIAITTDVSDESSVKALVEQTIARAGKIDILVNNAAVFASLKPTEPTEIDTALWDRVMAVNVRGPFLMVKHVAPHMIARHSGKIINIASGVAYKGMPRMLHYVTSKGAMLGFTRGLSRDLGPHGINVNTLAPGLILSDTVLENTQHLDEMRAPVIASRALKRDGYPQDLIGALIFLASPESDFMTGQTLAVDGGSINV